MEKNNRYRVEQRVVVGFLRRRLEWRPCGFYVLDSHFHWHEFDTKEEVEQSIAHTLAEQADWKVTT